MAYMANGGTLEGKELIKPETYETIMSDVKQSVEISGYVTSYTKGGFNKYKAGLPVAQDSPYYDPRKSKII
eukprot:CAMPEP_0116871908 /NCGR_PEP_ID=MMETSP0463-20121206/2465_1 /TAXON_ID=181622 /ORGANISM="Strombidinopsis sp, Strain SopsisLIS2011" /LENGTH=70 /DNA_ID=CAMNT_0004511213 /DNA_START=844 /DNA_END=1056 /DNA_ORIENTATION=-